MLLLFLILLLLRQWLLLSIRGLRQKGRIGRLSPQVCAHRGGRGALRECTSKLHVCAYAAHIACARICTYPVHMHTTKQCTRYTQCARHAWSPRPERTPASKGRSSNQKAKVKVKAKAQRQTQKQAQTFTVSRSVLHIRMHLKLFVRLLVSSQCVLRWTWVVSRSLRHLAPKGGAHAMHTGT